ncbi:GTP-binding protein HflX [Roseimicrobium gellanilyticum]|uniref:GTPase HflX n=1 Tax=Roseimicrobium gellanilyticum TaxID=748857 RepID=A0A366HQS6_9BACT|nr:GTPase HflX [Roseimicrobium gellanilyticum]RBP45444.1 GTP-binding protein HflX [Roseimicrobium gellanilyticum]
MFDIREKPNLVESALLISACFRREDLGEAREMLEELKDLVSTLSIGIAEAVTVHVRDMSPRYLTGSGKAKELMDHAKALGCDAIIFDNELSPGQQRAWEEESGLCVIDRQEVILDIFNLRARTREARLQVALARMEYSMPRLTRMWAHLDRQRGAGGGGAGGAARGEGELQLEIDRRLANKRIEKLKADLIEVRKQRDTQRKERSRVPVPHGAIVGYTNAGKSSLLNLLTKSDVLAENKLFATLDTSTRRMEMPDGQQILLTDTVGFVRKLPHDLVQSFRATLEEANLADFLIHVVDASHESAEIFLQTTTEVLKELGAGDKKTILVFNKIDLVSDPARIQELQHRHPDAIMMSVKDGTGLDELLHRVHEMVFDRVVRLDLRLPMHRLDLLALAHQEGKVLHEDYEADAAVVQCVVPKRLVSRFTPFAV